MPINPVHFAHAVCDEFLRYLFSAFPLSDPELAQQARKLLELLVAARKGAKFAAPVRRAACRRIAGRGHEVVQQALEEVEGRERCD